MPSTCLRRLSDTREPSRTEGYATLQAKITENILFDCPSREPVTRPASCCNLKKKKLYLVPQNSMSAENSRDYNDDYSSDSSYGAMESVHNSGAEDGAPDGATIDSEKSRHGNLSAKDASVSEVEDSQDSSNHTPAQKTEQR